MYPDPLATAIQKYRRKGVIVDAQLLLLYFVGLYDRALIKTFKRTDNYDAAEFNLLADILRWFSTIVTTPNILTEVSNLSCQLSGRARTAYFEEFKRHLLVLDEKYVPSASVREKPYLGQIGLTDSAIVHLATGQYLVLTDDLELTVFLQREGADVVNFTHFRYLALD